MINVELCGHLVLYLQFEKCDPSVKEKYWPVSITCIMERVVK